MLSEDETVKLHNVTPSTLRFRINLLDDGSVVTQDGEYLGTWALDAEDHPSFTPDGQTESLLWSPWVGLLCEEIYEWHQNRAAD